MANAHAKKVGWHEAWFLARPPTHGAHCRRFGYVNCGKFLACRIYNTHVLMFARREIERGVCSHVCQPPPSKLRPMLWHELNRILVSDRRHKPPSWWLNERCWLPMLAIGFPSEIVWRFGLNTSELLVMPYREHTFILQCNDWQQQQQHLTRGKKRIKHTHDKLRWKDGTSGSMDSG